MKKIFPSKASGIFAMVLLWCCLFQHGIAQDTTKSTRVLYKIPVVKSAPKECAAKPIIISDKNNTVISCVVNSASKEAVISVLDANGNLTKEKVVIKELNK